MAINIQQESSSISSNMRGKLLDDSKVEEAQKRFNVLLDEFTFDPIKLERIKNSISESISTRHRSKAETFELLLSKTDPNHLAIPFIKVGDLSELKVGASFTPHTDVKSEAQEATAQETSTAQETPTAQETSTAQETPTAQETSTAQETPTAQETSTAQETPTAQETS
ncbi:hypothetical protein V6259_18120, partial [Marinomonas sp. TI.3.20]|uniref:hypothetical protein n=1 Tax=Marinomonas sp. TI.3.20 TaxID=3121296 RepID=UPI00311D7A4A